MTYDAARHQRKLQMEEEHQRRTINGENLILSIGEDEEPYLYTPEQYGPGRGGLGPNLSGKVDWTVYFAFSFVIFGFAVVLTVLTFRDTGSLGASWLPFLLSVFLIWVAQHYMRQEYRADRARKAAGLPAPSEKTYW
ncbi:hypothetical protein [Arthrobacter bussei]|uniref:Uncharacterized protein n=1 Tax=Arthrobacter bussei TaxID=2594179 RepID=A0A7X1TNL8_9MICC|nr:hypothetical protein [Arthrobacter bussei]MPY10736.1 hypothetical protein [Arthrobacter bussei]